MPSRAIPISLRVDGGFVKCGESFFYPTRSHFAYFRLFVVVLVAGACLLFIRTMSNVLETNPKVCVEQTPQVGR